jgi:hypothetical protein
MTEVSRLIQRLQPAAGLVAMCWQTLAMQLSLVIISAQVLL